MPGENHRLTQGILSKVGIKHNVVRCGLRFFSKGLSKYYFYFICDYLPVDTFSIECGGTNCTNISGDFHF